MDPQSTFQIYDEMEIPDVHLIEDLIRMATSPLNFFESALDSCFFPTFQSLPSSLIDSSELSDQATTPSSTHSSDSSDIASTLCLPATGDTFFHDAIMGSSDTGWQPEPLQFPNTPVHGLVAATIPPKPSKCRKQMTKKYVCELCTKSFSRYVRLASFYHVLSVILCRPRELSNHISSSHLGMKSQ